VKLRATIECFILAVLSILSAGIDIKGFLFYPRFIDGELIKKKGCIEVKIKTPSLSHAKREIHPTNAGVRMKKTS
jgi:hypothetical protein